MIAHQGFNVISHSSESPLPQSNSGFDDDHQPCSEFAQAKESFAKLILIILINRFFARSDSLINDTQHQATSFGGFLAGGFHVVRVGV